MIQLPQGWEDMVQVRDFMRPVTMLGEVAVLVYAIKNKTGQTWVYQQNNQEYPLVSKNFNSIASREEKLLAIGEMYKRMIYLLPAIAAQQKLVEQDSRYIEINNQEWRLLRLPELRMYEEY